MVRLVSLPYGYLLSVNTTCFITRSTWPTLFESVGAFILRFWSMLMSAAQVWEWSKKDCRCRSFSRKNTGYKDPYSNKTCLCTNRTTLREDRIAVQLPLFWDLRMTSSFLYESTGNFSLYLVSNAASWQMWPCQVGLHEMEYVVVTHTRITRTSSDLIKNSSASKRSPDSSHEDHWLCNIYAPGWWNLREWYYRERGAPSGDFMVKLAINAILCESQNPLQPKWLSLVSIYSHLLSLKCFWLDALQAKGRWIWRRCKGVIVQTIGIPRLKVCCRKLYVSNVRQFMYSRTYLWMAGSTRERVG